MVLLSADEQVKVDEIGRRVGCLGQAVRQTIHAFHTEGLSNRKRKRKVIPVIAGHWTIPPDIRGMQEPIERLFAVSS